MTAAIPYPANQAPASIAPPVPQSGLTAAHPKQQRVLTKILMSRFKPGKPKLKARMRTRKKSRDKWAAEFY